MNILLLSFLLIFHPSTYAAVWNDTQKWDLQYEEEFSAWMESKNAHEKIFTDIDSPYFGIRGDCADTAYAFRAIFSFENSLPFVISNPSGSRRGKKISNRLRNWDYAGNTYDRLIAMINDIGESVGTENLSYIDTFPVALSYIQPGTLFTVSTKTKLGKLIRHTYNIKSINPIGTVDVIYGTQAGAANKMPLNLRRDRELNNLPHPPWGFRKFRWPEFLNQELDHIPPQLGPSLEQFSLAKKLGQLQFFKYLKKVLATTTEDPNDRMRRNFNSLCEDAQARTIHVNQALHYLEQIGNRCMNFTEFDTYSTPARDDSLIETFIKTQNAYMEIVSDDDLDEIDPELIEFSQIIFDKENIPRDRLIKFCPINYRTDQTMDLATLWHRLDNDIFSGHPNDIVEVRWGEKTFPLTKCPRWY